MEDGREGDCQELFLTLVGTFVWIKVSASGKELILGMIFEVKGILTAIVVRSGSKMWPELHCQRRRGEVTLRKLNYSVSWLEKLNG